MNFMRYLISTALAAIPLQGIAANAHFPNGLSLYGQPAEASTAASARVVNLATMKGSTIDYGETIVFLASDGRRFAWTFNGLDRRGVSLVQIAPTGFAAGSAMVFVGANPLTRN